MAKKDVQLVVRAKNEASSALGAVANSLDKVNKELLESVNTGRSASSGMDALGKEAADLAKRLESLRTVGQAATALNSVKNSIEGMRGVMSRTRGEFADFSNQVRAFRASLSGQREEAARLQETLDRQTAATKAARQETLKSSEATKALTAAERALKAEQAKKTPNAEEIAKATQRYQAAKARVEEFAASHARLKAEQETTAAAMASLTGAIRENEKALTRAEGKRRDALQGAVQQRSVIRETVGEYSRLSAELDKTGNALGAVASDQIQLAKATAQAEDAFRKQAEVMRALQRYSTGSAGGFADPKTAASLRAQREELAQTQSAWKALEGDIRRQAEAMRAAGQPTEAMAAALQRTVNAARQAKAEYASQAATLRQMEIAARGVSSAYGQADAHVRAFNAELARTPKTPPLSPWKRFYQSIYGDSRQAMSWMQRLRGEVLALGTAYVGLYGTINQAGNVITAYQGLEAAQNRLGVVFKQNGEAVRNELLWLERQAARLGIEFGTLSDQYGKFAIAAQSANFSAEGTREVFLGVAEAGRVAKLSNDQLKGTFLALEQMISKGRVQSEELRQQLGERLPGAVSIFARALGKSTAELAKMMELGQLAANEENMLAFAQELTRQFGPQLSESLRSTSAEIGRFFNNVYQAQLQVANGGFIEGLTKGLQALDKYFRSREGRDFFLSLGAAAGKLMEVLAQIPQYFGLITNAVKLLIALKMAQWLGEVINGFLRTEASIKTGTVAVDGYQRKVSNLGTSMRNAGAFFVTAGTNVANLTNRLRQGHVSLDMTVAKTRATQVAMTALSATMTGLTRVAGVLWAAIGGWVGIAAAGLSLLATTLIGNWVGGVDDATAKMDEHSRILQNVLTTYETLGKVTKDWADRIEDVSLAQAEGNFLNQVDLYKKAIDELIAKMRSIQNDQGLARVFSDAFSGEQLRQVRAFIDEFGGRNFDPARIEEFTDAIVAMNSEIDDIDAKKALLEIIELAEAALRAKGRMEEAAAVAKLKGSVLKDLGISAEEAEARIAGLTESVKDSEDSLGTASQSADAYRKSLDELKKLVPSVAAEMKKLQEYSELDVASLNAARDALAAGASIGEAMNLYGQGVVELDLKNIDTTPLVNSLDKNSSEIRSFYETIKGSANRWSSNPASPNAATLRTAAWQNANLSTIETASGIKTQVHKSAAAAFQGFINELEATGYDIRQFGGFNVRNKVGGKTLSEHAFGNAIDINWDMNPFADKLITDLPKDIGLMAAKYGLSWGGDWRNKKDAMHFEYTGMQAPGTERATDFGLKEQERKTSEMLKQRAATRDTLEDLRGQLETEKLRTLGEERRLAVAEAYQKALKADPGISAEELGKIAQIRGQIWDEENVIRVANAEQEAFNALIANTELEISQQEMLNAGKEREVFIEKAIAEAKETKKGITAEEIAQVAELAGRQYDLMNAEKNRLAAVEEAEKRVNDLLQHRQVLQETMKLQMEQGDVAGAQATKLALEEVNAELRAAIDNAIAMWQAIGGPQADMAIAKLNQTKLQISGTREQMGLFGLSMQQWQGIAQNFASGLTGVFKKFAQAIGQGEDAMQALGEAFLEFAANFLIQIGEMIIQQAILNALQGFGGGGGGFFGGLFGSGHTGGIVGATFIGSGNMTRTLPYFHDGGVVGLRPNETLAVLEQGEEVLTANDPRHILNGAGRGQGQTQSAPPVVKIVNTFDSAEVVSEGLATPVGESTVLNIVRKNANSLRQILGA